MAPELLLQRGHDSAADWFALACGMLANNIIDAGRSTMIVLQVVVRGCTV